MADVRNKLNPLDKPFLKGQADPGFSPERNKAIVEQTIVQYEKMRAKKLKEVDDLYAERADAVLMYLKAIDSGKNVSTAERYFGRRELARLRGDEIRQRLMANMKVKNSKGEIFTI